MPDIMRRLKNYAAAALAFIVICVILLSVAAVVLEATHDCEGAECPVCEFIHTLTDVTRGFIVVLAAIACVVVYIKRYAVAACLHRLCITPVTEKVRLRN